MKKLLFVFICFLSFISCDDGDIIIEEFDFEDTFNICGDIVFYKTKDSPSQSFSLLLTSPALTTSELIETIPDDTNTNLITVVNPEFEYALSETTNLFNYRAYSNLPSEPFCNDIPPADLNVTQNDISSGGTATIKTTLIEDDNDGVAAELEDSNNDGNLNNDDTDNDTIPNYLDIDDDGDNVLTITELNVLDPDTDGDGDPLTNPLDTDNDGIPNYLDNDDDGDGILTRNEENFSQDENPTNDITNNAAGPDYLNPAVTTNVIATAYRAHTITQEFTISIILENTSFPTISESLIDFGTLEDTEVTNSTRTPIPIFN